MYLVYFFQANLVINNTRFVQTYGPKTFNKPSYMVDYPEATRDMYHNASFQ